MIPKHAFSDCEDVIPSTCSLDPNFNTCEKIIEFDSGLCEAPWVSSGSCNSTAGLVKDTCKISCGICNGKYSMQISMVASHYSKH